ncbi:MAG: hypothetical protein H7Z17_11100 [Fuerstia sp.]|nr:hypothetical protein [Fuerstiella sp.]
MDEENPYAASESVSGFAPALAMSGFPTDRFYVDGSLIMCGTTVELPEICVLTGDRDDLVKVTKTISWLPKWYSVLILFGLIGIIVYIVLRVTQQKKCNAGYYLSRSSRNFRRFLTVVGWLGFTASIVFMIVAGNMDIVSADILLVTGIVAIFGFLVMAILGQLPIRIDRHENGVKFWLKGFKQPFFDQLRAMYSNGR